MSRPARARGLSLGLVVACLLASSAVAFKRGHSKYGRPLSWPADFIQVEVKRLPPALDAERARAVVGDAMERWRNVQGCRVPLGILSGEPPPHDTRQGRIVIDTPEVWPRKASETAWTEVRSDPDTGGIEGATILLNRAISWDLADPVAPDRVDLGSVLTHELGHALGLAHSFVRTSLMRAGIKAGERRRALTDDDVAGVCAVFTD